MTAERPDLDLSKLQPGDEPGVWVEPAGQWVLCPIDTWHQLLAAAEAGHTAEAPLHITAQATGRAPLRSADPSTHEVLLASLQAEATEEISRTAETLMPRTDSEEEERFTVPHTLPHRPTTSPAPPPDHRVSPWNTAVLVVGLLALLLTVLLQLQPLEPVSVGDGSSLPPVAQKTSPPPSTAPSKASERPVVQVAEAPAPQADEEAADAREAPVPAPEARPAPAEPTVAPTRPARSVHTLPQLREEGWAASDDGNFGEAISWFRKAVARSPQDVEANYGYGYALLKAGRRDDALVHLCAAQAADDGTLESEIQGILRVARLSCDGL